VARRTLESAGVRGCRRAARTEPKSAVCATVGGHGRTAWCGCHWTPPPPRLGSHATSRGRPRATTVSGGVVPGPGSPLRSWGRGQGPLPRAAERRRPRSGASRGALCRFWSRRRESRRRRHRGQRTVRKKVDAVKHRWPTFQFLFFRCSSQSL
jgi:hypothetical protein